MGFENEVEQSIGRSCRQADDRSKRTCDLTSREGHRSTTRWSRRIAFADEDGHRCRCHFWNQNLVYVVEIEPYASGEQYTSRFSSGRSIALRMTISSCWSVRPIMQSQDSASAIPGKRYARHRSAVVVPKSDQQF